MIKEIQLNRTIVSLDEAAIRQTVILRLLHCLGWDTFNVDEVHPECSVGGRKVDYALKHNGYKKVFIEVKRGGEDLENHRKQLLDYSFQEGVKTAVLTNGTTWWFYLPLNEGSWEQRKFYTIEISDQEAKDISKKFFEFLSKENVISGKAINNAERIHRSKKKKNLIRKTFPKAWNKLLNEADERLIDLIAETTENLCGHKPDSSEVENFLAPRILGESTTVQKRMRKKKYPVSKASFEKRENYTGKSIVSFRFEGKKYKVTSWIEMLRKICGIMISLHGDNFERVLKLKGRKRPYFTKDKNELRVPGKIEKTNIYVERNLNTNMIVKLSKDMVSLFGYDVKDLLIEAV